MPYKLPEHKMVFFFSPKSGGTSLRAFLFEIENGFAFQDYRVQGKLYDANTLVTNNRYEIVNHKRFSNWRRFALVRDPVTRFLSGYSNRVGHYEELSEKQAGDLLEKHNLAPDPDLETFVDNYEGYKKCSKSIERHFRLQNNFVGDDTGYYERIFRLNKVNELIDFVNKECGAEAAMPRLQTGGKKLSFDDLDRSMKSKIVNLVKEDIAFQAFDDMWSPYAEFAS